LSGERPFFASQTTVETATGLTERFSPERHVIAAFEGQDMTALGVLLRPDQLPDTLDLSLCSLKDGYFLVWPSQDGVVFSSDFEVLGESVNFCGTRELPSPEVLRRKARRLDQPVLVGNDSVWRNYFHWLALAVPRLAIGAKHMAQVGQRPVVALPDYLTHSAAGWPITFSERSWRQSMALIPADPLILPPGAYCAPRVDTVLLGSQQPAYLPAMGGFDAAFAPLREVVKPRDDLPRRILIRRTDTERLSPSEAELVERVATANWFTPILLDEMDLETQSALFAGAEVIVAAHGAGLANLVFCQPGTRVLELNRSLVHEPHLRPWFYLISRARGLRYGFLDITAGLTAAQTREALVRLMA
jgi:hypothetical protein